MNGYFRRFVAAGVLTVLFAAGCADAPLLGPEPADETWDEATTSRVFVGRDSFGVALNAKISGTVGQHAGSDCWILDGDGQVTHLGKSKVTGHTACVDDAANPTAVEGEFTYKGQTSGEIKGRYEGTLAGGLLEADVTIDKVKDVQAVKEEPEDTPPGGGTMTGVLTETNFRYTIEGWLFQRVR